jgi:hypothetical protein
MQIRRAVSRLERSLCGLCRQHPGEAVDGFEMLVERNELGSAFHGMGCDPDVVGRDPRALVPQVSGDSGKAV